MPHPSLIKSVASDSQALRVRAYRGDSAVFLAFDLDQANAAQLAGFAIRCTLPDGTSSWLGNRYSFAQQKAAAITAETRQWFPSNEAPFQKFWWADFPRQVQGTCTYEVTAMYRDGAVGKLRAGDSAKVQVEVGPFRSGDLTVAFTEGDLSSQAYANRFHNAPFRPAQKSIDFDTKQYEAQYEWLGANARKAMFDFLDRALQEGSRIDVFAYDFDEPDIIRKLAQFGKKLRLFQDDSKLHAEAGAMEPLTYKKLSAVAAAARQGHFERFAHDKIFIQRDPKTGAGIRVLTGSANFSLRGLYVQANSVLVFDNPGIAALYAKVFDSVFAEPSKFKSGDLAKQWFAFGGDGKLPKGQVSFAPHADSAVSLDEVASAITNAKSSVLFAIMELEGGGPVLEAIRDLPNREEIFGYGVSQTEAGLNLFKPGSDHVLGVPFSALDRFVPKTFVKEWTGGPGQVVHHKFVVVDFNGEKPMAFAGSSNLAAGGESSNGDNLLEFADAGVAQAYAIEAIRLVDHFDFRFMVTQATTIGLAWDDSWWQPYYAAKDIRRRSRELFATGAEP